MQMPFQRGVVGVCARTSCRPYLQRTFCEGVVLIVSDPEVSPRRSTGACAPLSAADAAQQAKALAIRNDKAETDARTQLTGGRNLAESAKLLGVPRPANAPSNPIVPMHMPHLGDAN